MQEPQKIVIQKYGGSSVATIEKLEAIAQRVAAKRKSGWGVVVVVSAMGNTTDNLLKLAAQITDAPAARELDMLLSTGERTTMALLSIAIQKYGAESISFTGSQSGIITTDSHSHARIISVRPYRIQDELERGKIVIVAGFQGTSYKNEITTLGRGGSDMTAIALAGALGAEACEIYSDVDGVYTADPKIVSEARKIDELSSVEMLEMAQHGAKVLHDEAVLYAQRHQISLYAKKSNSDGVGTHIRPDGWPDYALSQSALAPIAAVTAKKVMFVSELTDSLCVPSWLTSADGAKVMHMSHGADASGRPLFCALLDVWNCNALGRLESELLSGSGGTGIARTDVRNVTLIGLDIGRSPEIMARAGALLRERGVKPIHVFSSANALTHVVSEDETEAASRALHAMVCNRNGQHAGCGPGAA